MKIVDKETKSWYRFHHVKKIVNSEWTSAVRLNRDYYAIIHNQEPGPVIRWKTAVAFMKHYKFLLHRYNNKSRFRKNQFKQVIKFLSNADK